MTDRTAHVQNDRDPAAEPFAASPATAHPARSPGIALSVRRWFLVASPVLAGLFAVLGAAFDPAVGQDGPVLWQAYAENPEPLQFKSFGFHWAYAFWLVPTLLIAGLVRGRGAWIANVAAFLGFVGISTLPGLLFVDFYDSAIGQVAGAETTAQVSEVMEGMWGVPAIATPGVLGSPWAYRSRPSPRGAAASSAGGVRRSRRRVRRLRAVRRSGVGDGAHHGLVRRVRLRAGPWHPADAFSAGRSGSSGSMSDGERTSVGRRSDVDHDELRDLRLSGRAARSV